MQYDDVVDISQMKRGMRQGVQFFDDDDDSCTLRLSVHGLVSTTTTPCPWNENTPRAYRQHHCHHMLDATACMFLNVCVCVCVCGLCPHQQLVGLVLL